METAVRPRVYVVLLNWNNWKYTVPCLASLEKLDYPNWRCLVVDNGSTDDSVERIRRGFPWVEVVENGCNLGFAAGCNVGIRKALADGADYVWLLNNDTVVDPHALTAMVEVAESDPAVGLVGSAIYRMDRLSEVDALGGGHVSRWTGRARHVVQKSELARLNYITGASMLIRKQVLDDTGLLDERFFLYCDDSDFSLRAQQKGYKLAVACHSCVWHAVSGTAGKGSVSQLVHIFRSRKIFMAKHGYLPRTFIVLVILTLTMMGRVLRGQWRLAAEFCRALFVQEDLLSPPKE